MGVARKTRLYCETRSDPPLRRVEHPANHRLTFLRYGEDKMAEGGAKMDMPAHERTYSHFIGLFKYGAIACLAIGFLVMYLITR